TTALAAEMLVLGGLARDRADAGVRVERALGSGRAAERFGRMVVALGGPAPPLPPPHRPLPRAAAAGAAAPAGAGPSSPAGWRARSAWRWWRWAAGAGGPTTS